MKRENMTEEHLNRVNNNATSISFMPPLLYIFADFEIDRLFLFHSDTTFFISLTNGGVDYNHPFLL